MPSPSTVFRAATRTLTDSQEFYPGSINFSMGALNRAAAFDPDQRRTRPQPKPSRPSHLIAATKSTVAKTPVQPISIGHIGASTGALAAPSAAFGSDQPLAGFFRSAPLGPGRKDARGAQSVDHLLDFDLREIHRFNLALLLRARTEFALESTSGLSGSEHSPVFNLTFTARLCRKV